MSEIETNKEQQNENEMNKSLNKSFRQNMMCNHCMYVCKSYEEMKEHYKSELLFKKKRNIYEKIRRTEKKSKIRRRK